MKHSNGVHDLTSGPITRQLVQFSIPLVLGDLFQLSYNMVDTIVIGRFAGNTGLAAVGTCDQIMTLQNLVKDKFGYDMKYFRYPEGAYSDQSLGLVNNLGLKVVFWSYAYNDYSDEQPPVDESLWKAVDAVHPGGATPAGRTPAGRAGKGAHSGPCFFRENRI